MCCSYKRSTHSDVSNSVEWVKEFDGLTILSHYTSFSGGVAVLFSKNFTPYSYNVEQLKEGC